MTEELAPPPAVHPQALLLPWFLAGTLSEFEREAVNAHLSSCRGCQAELESVRASRALVRDALGPATLPSPSVQRRVLQSIGAPPQVTGRAGARPRRHPARVGRVAAGVSIAVIGTQAVAILYLADLRGRPPTPATIVMSRGLAPARTQLRLVLAPSATAGAIGELLRNLNAHIIDGPREGGAYLIELAPPVADGGASALDRLRSARALILDARAVAP